MFTEFLPRGVQKRRKLASGYLNALAIGIALCSSTHRAQCMARHRPKAGHEQDSGGVTHSARACSETAFELKSTGKVATATSFGLSQ